MTFATIGSAISAIDGAASVLGDLGITLSTGGVALAIGAISLAVTGLARILGNSQPAINEFSRGLNESREAHQNLRAELEQGQQATANTARALLDLAESGRECANATQIMQGMMDELNATVPGLSLAFDEHGRSINMTREELLGYIAAAAGLETHEANLERLGELYREQAEATRNYEEAQRRLAEEKETAIPIFDDFGEQIGYTYEGLRAAEVAAAYYRDRLGELGVAFHQVEGKGKAAVSFADTTDAPRAKRLARRKGCLW